MTFTCLGHRTNNNLVSMKLSYNDEESFKKSVGSLNFNNPPSEPNSLLGSGSSMLPKERNEDPNIILEVQRVPVGSSSPS